MAIGAVRRALRALEGKMAGAVLSPHVLPSQVSSPAFGQTASQNWGAYGEVLAVVTEYKLSQLVETIIHMYVPQSVCVWTSRFTNMSLFLLYSFKDVINNKLLHPAIMEW